MYLWLKIKGGAPYRVGVVLRLSRLLVSSRMALRDHPFCIHQKVMQTSPLQKQEGGGSCLTSTCERLTLRSGGAHPWTAGRLVVAHPAIMRSPKTRKLFEVHQSTKRGCFLHRVMLVACKQACVPWGRCVKHDGASFQSACSHMVGWVQA